MPAQMDDVSTKIIRYSRFLFIKMGNCGCRERSKDNAMNHATSSLEDAIAFLEAAANSNLIKIAGPSTATSEPVLASPKSLDKLVDWGDLEQDAVHCTENAKGFFSIFADDPSDESAE